MFELKTLQKKNIKVVKDYIYAEFLNLSKSKKLYFTTLIFPKENYFLSTIDKKLSYVRNFIKTLKKKNNFSYF
jgi:hypothetical protein